MSEGRGDQDGFRSSSVGQFQLWATSYHPLPPLQPSAGHRAAGRVENTSDENSSPNQPGTKSLEEEREKTLH